MHFLNILFIQILKKVSWFPQKKSNTYFKVSLLHFMCTYYYNNKIQLKNLTGPQMFVNFLVYYFFLFYFFNSAASYCM